MHALISGRLRKHVKQIESATNTAIYFPPAFPQVHGYTPPNAHRRRDDELYITGERDHDIFRAKTELHELSRCTQPCVKEIRVSSDKIDHIMLERLDQMREVTEFNGSYILFPRLGLQLGAVRVQGTDMLHVERTIKEVMSIVCFAFQRLCPYTLTVVSLVTTMQRRGRSSCLTRPFNYRHRTRSRTC